MSTYHFEAITQEGKRVRGRVDADNTLIAVEALENDRGYHVISVKTEEEIARLEEEKKFLDKAKEDLELSKRRSEEDLARKKVQADSKEHDEDLKKEAQIKDSDSKVEHHGPPKPSKITKLWHGFRYSLRSKPKKAIKDSEVKKETSTDKVKKGRSKDLEIETKDEMGMDMEKVLGHKQKRVNKFSKEDTASPNENDKDQHAPLPDNDNAKASQPEYYGPMQEQPVKKKSLFKRIHASLFPGHAAKVAAASSAQDSAEAAAKAAETAHKSATLAKNIAKRAATDTGGDITKYKDEDQTEDELEAEAEELKAHFSSLFEAILVPERKEKDELDLKFLNRRRKKGLKLKLGEELEDHDYVEGKDMDGNPSLRLKKGKHGKKGSKAEYEYIEEEYKGLLRLFGKKTKRVRKKKAKDEEISLAKGIAKSTKNKSHGDSSSSEDNIQSRKDLSQDEKDAGSKIDLNIERVEIEGTGLIAYFKQVVENIKYKIKVHKRDVALKKEKKQKEKEAKERARREERRNKLIIAKAKALKKAKEKAKKESKGKDGKGKTLLMKDKNDVDPGKLTWYQKLFPSLFKPKHGSKTSKGDAKLKRLNFGLSDEEKAQEEQKQKIMIQGFKPTGNPITDAYGKINEYLIQHQGVKTKELVTFFTLLSTMINAGIPLVKSLHQLVEQQKNPRLKRILFQIVYEIENGKSLSKSMAQFDDIFNDSQIGMIGAGEASGQLGPILKRIAIESEKSHAMVSKVKGALIYPIVILVVLGLVMVVVMVAVVPKMVEIFEGAGVDLPLPTRILIAMSDFFINRWYVLVVVVGGLVFGFTTYVKTDEGKYYWHYAKLKMPIFGALFTKVSLARFTSSLSSLSTAGLSIIKALKINADSVGNEIYRQEILATAESVKKGISIAKDLKGNKLFPAMVVDMIAVGEETAQVASVSEKIAGFYEDEVENMVKNMQSLMEPIIIVVLGISVGGLVSAIMMPIMQLSEVATQ